MELNLLNSYQEPDKEYDANLKLTDEYQQSLPDLQDKPFIGANVAIPHVGIHNFKLPLKIKTRAGSLTEDPSDDFITIEASVTGTVSLSADKKGINMSRIIRSFYEHNETSFRLPMFEKVLLEIMEKSECKDGHLLIHFNYPIKQDSLRTGMSGYQYYEVTYRIDVKAVYAQDMSGKRVVYGQNVYHVIEFDFVYSSACPCSYELAEHARMYRNKAVVPHSQRSVTRVSLLLDQSKETLWLEDIKEACVQALQTETQVMVKRPDEQAFAELNGSYTKFVEDATRQLYKVFDETPQVKDFRILCSHLESLHSHDAIALVTKGKYFPNEISYHELRSLVR